MAEERVHFSGEREREIQEGFSRARSIQEREEKLRESSEVCPGYLNSALRDLPMVVLTN